MMGLWSFLTGNDSFSQGIDAGEQWVTEGGDTDVSKDSVYQLADKLNIYDCDEFYEGFDATVHKSERSLWGWLTNK